MAISATHCKKNPETSDFRKCGSGNINYNISIKRKDLSRKNMWFWWDYSALLLSQHWSHQVFSPSLVRESHLPSVDAANTVFFITGRIHFPSVGAGLSRKKEKRCQKVFSCSRLKYIQLFSDRTVKLFVA